MNNLEIILNKGKNISGSSDLNYYAKSENIHIMDNHLAAIHGLNNFAQGSHEFEFYHVDAHYDLGGLNDYHDQYINKETDIGEIKNLDSIKTPCGVNHFLYDNYIHLFCEMYPKKISKSYFVTHQTCEFNYDFSEYEELTIFQLINYHPNSPDLDCVLNLDIDIFYFQNLEGKKQPAFAQNIIDQFSEWL